MSSTKFLLLELIKKQLATCQSLAARNTLHFGNSGNRQDNCSSHTHFVNAIKMAMKRILHVIKQQVTPVRDSRNVKMRSAL